MNSPNQRRRITDLTRPVARARPIGNTTVIRYADQRDIHFTRIVGQRAAHERRYLSESRSFLRVKPAGFGISHLENHPIGHGCDYRQRNQCSEQEDYTRLGKFNRMGWLQLPVMWKFALVL
jgi:hypothetical protein